ncbi:uncharacterized [Tachysurus ichikawai]
MSWDGNQQYLDGGSVSDQILQQQMLLMLSSTSLRSHRHTGRSYSRLMWESLRMREHCSLQRSKGEKRRGGGNQSARASP